MQKTPHWNPKTGGNKSRGVWMSFSSALQLTKNHQHNEKICRLRILRTATGL
jgi:hypothetical protein